MRSTGRKPLYHHLYFQVVCAILIGILLGHFYPTLAVRMQPLGEAFIKTIKMLIAPIIFCTVVHGIASMNDMKKVGRVGLKAIVYFEVVTTLALIVGLIIVNLWQPGAGMNVDSERHRHQVDPELRDASEVAEHGRLSAAHHSGNRCRRLLRGRDPPGVVHLDTVRLRAPHGR